jgi:hypothetical protein
VVVEVAAVEEVAPTAAVVVVAGERILEAVLLVRKLVEEEPRARSFAEVGHMLGIAVAAERRDWVLFTALA